MKFAILLICVTGIFAQDSLNLVKFYNSTAGHKWINNSKWLSEAPISEWYGVTVLDNFVTTIELPRNRLSGNLMEEIGNFTKLEKINLSDNNLTGDLPYGLQNLPDLKEIDLSHNNFSGNPLNILSTIKALTTLNLSHNTFKGEIPKIIGNLTNLEILDLSNNQFAGKIPSDLFRLTKLEKLGLHSNSLSGKIPWQIRYCINLNILDLSRNNLSGKIPKEIGKLINLKERLAINHNQLHGLLPKEISRLSELEHMWLNNNQFSGILPFDFSKMKNLKSLFVDNNKLVGPLPQTIGNLRNLEMFFAQNNNFSGSVPQQVWFLPNLKILKLNNNRFSGNIPGNLKMLKSIHTIDLSDNQFTVVTYSIVLPNSLLSINFSNNKLFCDGDYKNSSFTKNIGAKAIGLTEQNCETTETQTYSISTNLIDFSEIKTDSTAMSQFWLTGSENNSVVLHLQHFDADNFSLSDTLYILEDRDTADVYISYSPIETESHHDVILITDIFNKTSQFIEVVGEGIETTVGGLDMSKPWKFKLYPITKDDDTNKIKIEYDVPEKRVINITIYNLGGRPIRTISNTLKDIGLHTFLWDKTTNSGNIANSGEYRCVMQADDFVQIQHFLIN